MAGLLRRAHLSATAEDNFWHGSTPPNAEKVCEGVFVVPRFMQDCLGIDPATVFAELQSLKVHSPEQPISFRPNVPEMIPGQHHALHYRGHALRRMKVWLQTSVAKGCFRYGYTGWQWLIAMATKNLRTLKSVHATVVAINAGLLTCFHNHAVGTLYRDGSDNIGAHDDKMKDIDPNSWIIVIKVGVARPFEFYDADTKEVVWSQVLEAGTAVFMNAAGNAKVKHGVPEFPGAGPSGSIVTRCITTVVPWKTVEKKAAAAEEARIRRAARKAERAILRAAQLEESRAERARLRAEEEARRAAEKAEKKQQAAKKAKRQASAPAVVERKRKFLAAALL